MRVLTPYSYCAFYCSFLLLYGILPIIIAHSKHPLLSCCLECYSSYVQWQLFTAALSNELHYAAGWWSNCNHQCIVQVYVLIRVITISSSSASHCLLRYCCSKVFLQSSEFPCYLRFLYKLWILFSSIGYVLKSRFYSNVIVTLAGLYVKPCP